MKFKPFSLRAYLTHRLLSALYLLWLVSTIVGYFATINYANHPYDQVLLQRALALAQQLGLGTEQERLDIVPNLPDGSDPAMPDRVVFTVSDADGRKLTGNASISRPLSYRREREGPVFSDGEREGAKTRMVSLVYTTLATGQTIQLHVSETVNQRQALIRGILAYIVIPQLLLILMAWVAVWYGLKQGLKPLDRLRNEVESRHRDDLHHLDISIAPIEVHPLIEAVNGLLDRLEQVLNAQKRFVADAAHQLRTPLAGLKTQIELALRESDSGHKHEILQNAQTSTSHATHLVNQLLMLARNEPGGQDRETFLPIDLSRLARDNTMHWVPIAMEKNIDLGFEGVNKAMVLGDEDSLGEMLGNLIDNAIRYTQPGGHVTVSIHDQGDHVLMVVQDNGPGIAEAHREQVFQRFYRIIGSGQSGSGLGLSIASEVAKHHGATIVLDEGDEGSGTRVSLRFVSA